MIETYRPLALSIASGYFMEGHDSDDVRQEAMIGLVVAVDGWDRSRGTLPAFVRLVINRRLVTQIRLARGLKHRMLTYADRGIRASGDNDAEVFEIDQAIPDVYSDPALVVERRETLREFLDEVDRFSEMERSVVLALARGLSYDEAAETLGIGFKAVDNARARAKAKVERRLAA